MQPSFNDVCECLHIPTTKAVRCIAEKWIPAASTNAITDDAISEVLLPLALHDSDSGEIVADVPTANVVRRVGESTTAATNTITEDAISEVLLPLALHDSDSGEIVADVPTANVVRRVGESTTAATNAITEDAISAVLLPLVPLALHDSDSGDIVADIPTVNVVRRVGESATAATNAITDDDDKVAVSAIALTDFFMSWIREGERLIHSLQRGDQNTHGRCFIGLCNDNSANVCYINAMLQLVMALVYNGIKIVGNGEADDNYLQVALKNFIDMYKISSESDIATDLIGSIILASGNKLEVGEMGDSSEALAILLDGVKVSNTLCGYLNTSERVCASCKGVFYTKDAVPILFTVNMTETKISDIEDNLYNCILR